MTHARPNRPPDERHGCQVAISAALALDSGRQFLKSLRRLRKALQGCRRCGVRSDCPARQAWNAQIDAAVSEVWAEWDAEG